ncbi:hypothetical protein QUW57_00385 [Phocaeicola plebeius]|uniref:HU family DNA-binding protein n=1 Tax=Phocaeicola plebeius TaxID=310297 RepID=UPI0021ACF748|nr:hypothetical protein [Phocaeicola plebeius]MCR8882287.1 hypothetical protein [Phocaeicola plebeius]MDM8285060.1 hypothetical protein [Phocaeicola plebeius]
MKYKLIQKVNPNRRDDPPQWYATPITGESEGADATTRAATENTTTAPVELMAGLVHLSEYAISKLSKGEPVPLGEMGDLRITFRSKGVADINEFNPNTMIYEARLRFVPKRAFRNAIIQQLTFENAGVLVDGIDYASLAAYRKAKGLPSGGGEEEGGEEEFPLG